ncbi:MAG: hypothetical protein KGZ43_07505 [Sulfuritalea sp.]|nr:hypothetical protein [Sulfuritalea sp.]
MKSEMHFRVTYDGPGLAAARMDVAHLAPALLALAALLAEANATLNGDKTTVSVSVQAGFRQGSFGIDLLIQQDLMQQVVNLFKGDEASAFANATAVLEVLGMIGGGALGLIALIKKIRGRKVERIEPRAERVAIVTAEETIVVDRATGLLYANRKLRGHLKEVLAPLAQGAAARFVSGRDEREEVAVEAVDLPWFEPAATVEVLADSVLPGFVLQIESAVFKEGNKWRFSDGTNSWHAEIADAGFLARIESGEERFGKGDVLIADVQRIQTVADGKLATEHRIVRVVEHRVPLQRPLL